MLRNKLMTACSVAVLMAALYGCSSSSDDGANMQVQDLQDRIAALTAELGEGEELTPEALAALIQAKADAEAALADAMIAHQATLAAAAMDAETAKTAALSAAAMEAMTAREAALAAAAMEAMTAQEAALAAAAMEAMTAQEAALAAAAMEAMTAHDAALAAAAMEAMTAHDAALAAAAIAAADMAAADKAAALADAKTAADAAQAMALADAKTAADAAQAMALADAKTAADAAQAMALADAKTAADAAQVDALADAKVEADAALKVVQDELAEIKTDLVDEIAAGALKEKIARAGRVHTAIDVNPGGDMPKAMPTGGGVSAVTATRNAAGMVTVDVNSAVDDDYAGGETNAGSSAWNSVTMTKTNAGDDSTDMVVIYTDIDAPADVLFTKRYPAMTNFLAGPTDDDAKGNVAKARSDNFPTGNGASLNYGEIGGIESGNPLTFRGTFDNVPGVFACTAVGCTLTTNAKGELIGTDLNWEFTPNLANDATVKVEDANYAYFGWWLNKPEKADSPHMVEVFAGGVGDPATIGDAIVGTARYAGPAAGKYATKTFTAGVQKDAAVGHFTATANLTAKFGDEDLANGSPGTISGTVASFTLDDVTAVPWKVTLEPITLTDGAATFTGNTEVNFGGGFTDKMMPAGTWQGEFYGEGAEPADAPSTVVGTFGAATENARLLGAFGASKQ